MIRWNDNYITGIEKLDKEHQQLFQMADQVLNKFYAEEADNCAVYSSASFTKNKNEYLPIPFAQISASNGHYTQNCGGW